MLCANGLWSVQSRDSSKIILFYVSLHTNVEHGSKVDMRVPSFRVVTNKIYMIISLHRLLQKKVKYDNLIVSHRVDENLFLSHFEENKFF